VASRVSPSSCQRGRRETINRREKEREGDIWIRSVWNTALKYGEMSVRECIYETVNSAGQWEGELFGKDASLPFLRIISDKCGFISLEQERAHWCVASRQDTWVFGYKEGDDLSYVGEPTPAWIEHSCMKIKMAKFFATLSFETACFRNIILRKWIFVNKYTTIQLDKSHY